MNQLKEIVYLKLKKDLLKKQKPSQINQFKIKIEEIRKRICSAYEWSQINYQYSIKGVFMTIENKAVYNNGIIIQQINQDNYQVQFLSPSNEQLCRGTIDTPLAKVKNHVNYYLQSHVFYSNPTALFETAGYKTHNSFEHKNLEYYHSLMIGLEVIFEPRNGYIQLIEVYPAHQYNKIYQSGMKKIINLLKDYLDLENQIFIKSDTLKPQDFGLIYE